MTLSFGLALTLHLLPGDWNGVHPQVRLEHQGWTAGTMLNSESRLSLLAGYTWEWDKLWLELGGATGYSGAPVVPWVRAGYGPVFIAPAATIEGDVGLVVGVQFLMEGN